MRQCIAGAMPEIAQEIAGEPDQDVIGFYVGSKPKVHMVASVIYNEPNYPSHVERADHDDVKRMCSMIYDGVHMVFGSVCGEFNKTHTEQIEGLALNFDNEAMAFVPQFINFKLQKFNMAIRKRDELQKHLTNPANAANFTTISGELQKVTDELASYSLEQIEDCEVLTAEKNLLLSGGWIYIQVEERPEVNLDLCLTRLPLIPEPAEGDLIDLLNSKSG